MPRNPGGEAVGVRSPGEEGRIARHPAGAGLASSGGPLGVTRPKGAVVFLGGRRPRQGRCNPATFSAAEIPFSSQLGANSNARTVGKLQARTDVETAMVFTYELTPGAQGVRRPADRLLVSPQLTGAGCLYAADGTA